MWGNHLGAPHVVFWDDHTVSEIVTSPHNAQLKLVRKLRRRRTRDSEGAFVVEGEDLVLSGIESGARPRVLLVDGDRVAHLDESAVACPVLHVQSTLLASVATMPYPPRVIGVFDHPRGRDLAVTMDERARSSKTGPWIAIDGLGDPGNVGTIIRTAAALGAGGVVTFPGTADPFGPKAVRATMGACFRVPIVRLDRDSVCAADELDAVRSAIPSLDVVALDAEGNEDLWDVNLGATSMLVIGGEREGISPALRSCADVVARIPQELAVDSINAAVSASIALYEWRRKASGRP